MIAKAKKGTGFRGALNYDLGKEHARIVDSNMVGMNPRELACEFGEIRKLRPKLGKAVLHVSLSAAPGEHFTDAQWATIGRRYLDGMGLTANQYVTTRHEDTEHEHVHLLINRVTMNGGVVSDSHDYRRHEVIMRAIERDYSLQQVPDSKSVQRRAPTQGEIEEGLRTGAASIRQRLQQMCDAAVQRAASFSEYVTRLEAVGIVVTAVTQLDGSKLSGLTYQLDGTTMKGSDLGKGYSPMGLAKRGVSYDKDRDFATSCGQRERNPASRFDTADRRRQASAPGQRGTIGYAAGTGGASDGGVDGRDARDLVRDPDQGTAAQRGDQGTDRRSGENLPGSGDERREIGAAAGGISALRGGGPLPAGANDRGDLIAASGRIVALAGAIAVGSEARPSIRDRTYEAVARQLNGMGAERYQLTLTDCAGQVKTKREWTASQILESISWLKRMNARGQNIEVALVGTNRLVCIDASDTAAIKAMSGLSLAPCAKIESRVAGVEYWISVPTMKTLSPQHDVHLLRQLLSCAARKKAGRLAGFVHHLGGATSGRGHYVLAHNAEGCKITERHENTYPSERRPFATSAALTRTKGHSIGK